MAEAPDDLVKKFPWGFVIEFMEIGPYYVRAFHPKKLEDNRGVGVNDTDVTHYHGYIDGKDCHESWLTLDDALAGMIVRRNVGLNCRQINEHFMAGLNAMKTTQYKDDHMQTIQPTEQKALDQIAKFRDRTGMAKTMFGKNAVGDANLIGQLEGGRQLRHEMREKIKAYIKTYKAKP